jgi:hypothetical protein
MLGLGKLRRCAFAGRPLVQEVGQACSACGCGADQVRTGEAGNPDRASDRDHEGADDPKESIPATALHDLPAPLA